MRGILEGYLEPMKIELEIPDSLAQAIADRVTASLRPLLAQKRVEGEDAILTPEQLAQHLQVTRQWIYERVSLGEIPHTKVGKYIRFRRSIIEMWVESRSMPAANHLSRSLKAIK